MPFPVTLPIPIGTLDKLAKTNPTTAYCSVCLDGVTGQSLRYHHSNSVEPSGLCAISQIHLSGLCSLRCQAGIFPADIDAIASITKLNRKTVSRYNTNKALKKIGNG